MKYWLQPAGRGAQMRGWAGQCLTMGRGVGSATGDLVHTNPPVPGERGAREGHRHGGVGGEGGDGGVHVHVLAIVVAADGRRGMG